MRFNSESIFIIHIVYISVPGTQWVHSTLFLSFFFLQWMNSDVTIWEKYWDIQLTWNSVNYHFVYIWFSYFLWCTDSEVMVNSNTFVLLSLIQNPQRNIGNNYILHLIWKLWDLAVYLDRINLPQGGKSSFSCFW